MMKIRLYRALRDDERNCQLLGMEPTNSRCTTSAVDHVLNGSQSHFYSPYISTTKDYDVALFFAAKAHHQRGAPVVRIAVLDIAVDIKTLDLTNEGVLHDLGFEHESRAWNYAQAFQEVLLHRCIEAKEIKYVHCITNPAESLPNSRMALNSFREFRSFTKRVVILENSFPDNEIIESVLQIHETKADEKISPMTKGALEAIAVNLKNLDERLNSSYSNETHNMKELRKNMLEYIRLLQSLIQLLTGDAQTYNVISSGLTSQLPVASREQFATTDSSYVFDSSHGSEFDQTTLGSTKSPAAKNRTGSKSESLLNDHVIESHVTAQGSNQVVNGVVASSDTIYIHELLKTHKLIYSDVVPMGGMFSFSGMREIKNKGDNSVYKMSDGVSTFYGSLDYDYSVRDANGVLKTIRHDVVAMHPVFLDAKARGPPKNGTGIYGVDWWQVYLPTGLLQKLSRDIQAATGFVLSDEGIISDDAQSLHSVNINCRNVEESPKITSVMVKEEAVKTGGEGGKKGDDADAAADEIIKYVHHQPMGTLAELMEEGGEEYLLGGTAYFSVGVSYRGVSGSEGPQAGSNVKLSLKMKGFHAFHVVEGGIRRITYKSKSNGLEY